MAWIKRWQGYTRERRHGFNEVISAKLIRAFTQAEQEQ